MTTRSYEDLVCACGHEGQLRLSENDQPYSSLWEKYSLVGFSGKELVVENYRDMPADLLGYLAPKCPECGETGKVTYAKKT